MINRRMVLAAIGTSAVLPRQARTADAPIPLPAEWERHAGCVMAWCAATEVYTPDDLFAIHAEQVAIARAIAGFEPVTMLVNPMDRIAAARQLGPDIAISVMDHNDMWTRDTLPIVAVPDARQNAGSAPRTATGLNFNVWGEKYPGYADDRTLAQRFASSKAWDFRQAALVTEGGALDTDGQRTLLVTETCLLNANRNPGLTKGDIEDALHAATGADSIVWLWGSEVDMVTDGHVDSLARFIRPGLVVVEVTDDKEDPEYHDLQENAVRLEAARDARNEKLEVVRLNRPRWEEMPERGEDFAASYVNSYFPNGGIVMPRFGDDARDEAARALFAELEPDRRIVQLDIDAVGECGGGIHCLTMQIPA